MFKAVTAPKEVAALVEQETHEEGRIAVWPLIPEYLRRLAMALAGLPDQRANDDLRTFNRNERSLLATALRGLLLQVTMAETCMRDTHRKTTVLH